MLIVINIILLLLATAGSIIAIGGETWEKSTITYRGKLAVLFLALAFSVGVVKEFLVRNERKESRQQIMTKLDTVQIDLRYLSTKDLTADQIRTGLSQIANRLNLINTMLVSPTEMGDPTESTSDRTEKVISGKPVALHASPSVGGKEITKPPVKEYKSNKKSDYSFKEYIKKSRVKRGSINEKVRGYMIEDWTDLCNEGVYTEGDWHHIIDLMSQLQTLNEKELGTEATYHQILFWEQFHEEAFRALRRQGFYIPY